MSLTPRRTVRVPDDEWDAGHARAQERRRQSDQRAPMSTRRIHRRKTTVNGEPQVVRGLVGTLDEIERLYRTSRWIIEEYHVSLPRPVKRKSA